MIKVVADRDRKRVEKEICQIADKLVQLKTTDELEGILKSIFVVMKRDVDLEKQKKWLEKYFSFVNEICLENEEAKKNILATDIVFYDKIRAESMVVS